MKKLSLLSLLILLCLAGQAQSSQSRNVKDFSKIQLNVPATVYLSQGDYSLKIEGEDLDEIETRVKGSTLQIRQENEDSWFNWSWGNRDEVIIYISLPRLESLRMSGSGSIKGQNRFTTDKLDLHISGSGSIELVVRAQQLDTHISGSGSMKLAGAAQQLEAHISGSGKIKAEDLQCLAAEVHISGSGDCYLHVSRSLDAHVSGSGDIYYRGTPPTVNSRTSGSGSVRKF